MSDAPLVIVVDDDRSVRRSLTRLLGSVGYAVEAFASAPEFLERELPDRPCCLVLDVRMPGLSGIELQRALSAAGRRVPIVFVSGHADVPMSVAAMKAGAIDLLTKPVDAKDLLDAIRRAVAHDARERSDAAQLAEVEQLVSTLTPRETQVFALVAVGRPNKQIAFELGMSEKTVKVHRARVMRKLRAGSLPDLVRIADRIGVTAARA